MKANSTPFNGAFRLILLVVVPAVCLSGCGRAGPADEHRDRAGVMFLCGAGLRPPMDGAGVEGEPGILERFRAEHSEISVETTYGASNLLLGQLKLIGTADLFFPGDDFYIEEAKREGFVHATREVARFVPVIMVAPGNPLEIEDASDLAAPGVRLAVAERRAAAIGRITPEIFENNGVPFDSLSNIVFTGVTAPEVAQAVALGHADATITWRPVAEQYPRDGTWIEIAPEKNVFSRLVIAVLKTSKNKDAAMKFAEFLSGSEGRAVFEQYHYDVP